MMADIVWATFSKKPPTAQSVKQCQEPTWRHLSFHDNSLGCNKKKIKNRQHRRFGVKRRTLALDNTAYNCFIMSWWKCLPLCFCSTSDVFDATINRGCKLTWVEFCQRHMALVSEDGNGGELFCFNVTSPDASIIICMFLCHNACTDTPPASSWCVAVLSDCPLICLHGV